MSIIHVGVSITHVGVNNTHVAREELAYLGVDLGMKNDRENELVALIVEVTKPLNLPTPECARLDAAITSALKEQHRNTRYQAIDKLNEIRERFGETYTGPPFVEQMMDEITGAIHNLRFEA